MVNEMIQYSGSPTLINVGINTQPATFQWLNNLWYNSNNPSSSAPTDYSGGEESGYDSPSLFFSFPSVLPLSFRLLSFLLYFLLFLFSYSFVLN